MTNEQKDKLKYEINKLHERHELADIISPDYFEPGMMEYLDQSDGLFDEASGSLLIRFESKGTRYDGRTERIEKVRIGDKVKIVREPTNQFNHNNFMLLTDKDHSIGNMPAEICNAIAPLYDEGVLSIEDASVSFVDPISKRNRHAKQAVLFVEMRANIK